MRTATLPGGRSLLVRPVAAADEPGLAELYAALDPEARYRRFFSVYRPPASFFARMTSIRDRGGAGLVAVVHGDEGSRIVADASYERLADGDGELAITVARDWRGWLGPYLLDALVEVAAADAVPNLVADVLATNRPMLALFRARGCAFEPTGDYVVLRAKVGTATPMPTWSGPHRRLRVLVEGSGGHWRAAAAAAAAGLDVLGCPGPDELRSRCPAMVGSPCPLAAAADAIVVCHPHPTERWQALRAAHPVLHPAVAVHLDDTGSEAAPMPGEASLGAPTVDEAVRAVQRAAGALVPRG